MSEIPSSNWSETANSNNAATPDGWPEGQAPSTVNNCARELMAAVKREWNRNNATVTSSGTNTVTLTYTTAPAAYVQGMRFSFIVGTTNTAATTINVNSLGAKSVFADGKACAGGELQAGMIAEVVYDGTQFQIISRPPLISAPYGFKNAIINGDFQVQQRAAGGAFSMVVAASQVQYTYDRWVLTTNANQASTLITTAGTGVAAQSRYAAVLQRNNGQTGTGTMTFQAPLTTDQLAPLLGKIVTLQFKAAAGASFLANNGQVSCALYMGTGTEGKRGAGFTGETSTCSSTTTFTSSFQQITATSAAVVPTTTTQGCILFSWTPTATAGATDQLIIAEVQLEVGGVATSFDRRPFDVALGQCQAYFEKSFPYATAPVQAVGNHVGAATVFLPTGASGTFGLNVRYNVQKHSLPTLTTYNPISANANWRDLSNGADRVITTSGPGTSGFFASGAAGVAASQNTFHWTADSDL